MANYGLSNLLIIADDFTGANDAGVQLTKKGANVNVYFDWSKKNKLESDIDAIVISTDSRALPMEESKQRIQSLLHNNSFNRPIYKKIDSTLRGNIGAEIEAVLSNSGYKLAIVVPAFPTMKRIVKNGISYVNGEELLTTEFASDPKTPIYSSRVKECIAQQTELSICEVDLTTIRNNQLPSTIKQAVDNGNQIVVIDAETDDDLKNIANQLTAFYEHAFLVGSAGLIDFLPVKYQKTTTHIFQKESDKLLVVAGSMSLTTYQQIEYALQHSADLWQVVDIKISDFLPELSSLKLQHYILQIKDALKEDKNVILRTCQNPQDRYQIDNYCQQYNLDRKTLGEHICQCLGEIVKQVPINNLFLTGGDVAIAIAKSLGAIGFHIQGEVASGIPHGSLIGNIDRNYHIFTKAGGFGEKDILTKSLQFI